MPFFHKKLNKKKKNKEIDQIYMKIPTLFGYCFMGSSMFM